MCCVCWIESWGDRVLMVSEWGPSHVWGMLVVSVVSVVRIVWLGPGGRARAGGVVFARGADAPPCSPLETNHGGCVM